MTARELIVALLDLNNLDIEVGFEVFGTDYTVDSIREGSGQSRFNYHELLVEQIK